MSFGSIIGIARSAINAHQTALQVASQNIANAEVEGYSRQRVELAPTTPQLLPMGSIGTGVRVVGIERTRDALLDTAFRRESTASGNSGALADALGQVEAVLGEPSDTGLASTLDAFWSAWSDLASDPTSSAARGIVRQRGSQVAGMLNDFASRIASVDRGARGALDQDVADVNRHLREIADINRQIIAAESDPRGTANELRDARDLAMDRLSTLLDFQGIERHDGTMAIYIAGRTVVDSSDARQLQTVNGMPPTVTIQGTTEPLNGLNGRIGANIDLIGTQIPTVTAKLDSLAKGLVEQVNAIHSTGVVWSGVPPVAAPAGNFFDVTVPAPPGGDPRKTAAGIRLAMTLTSGDAVAVSAAGATGPGNNAVALALANVRDATVTFTDPTGAQTLGTTTIGEFYADAISQLGLAARDAADSATVHETLVANADNRRQSASGVSTDEELIAVIQAQHAYQAAARLVSVLDEMTQTLVNLGR